MLHPKKVTIYTDGACFPNPGPGGYGVILLWNCHRKELSGGFRQTTSNRMELQAAIVGLKALKWKCQVALYSDSQYLADGLQRGWAQRWRANGWMRTKEEKACNQDLWEMLLNACAGHEVTAEWVRGHTGNPENERCDRLAAAAARGVDLPADAGYELVQAALPNVPLFETPLLAPVRSDHPEQVCLRCRLPIPKERLEAVPNAKLCVACQRTKELEPSCAVASGGACPRCARKGIQAALVCRTARDPTVPGYFLACSRYPSCRYIDRD